MNLPACVKNIPELQPLLASADHVDDKALIGEVSLREFIASMLNYQPNWLSFLFGVRAVFVRFLGMKQAKLAPPRLQLTPEQISLTPGDRASFFTVKAAKEDLFWVVEANDKHLRAALVVVVEQISPDVKKFHVLTVVHYHNWRGPFYFNVIRPFHHFVVLKMVEAGVHPLQPLTI